MSAGDNNGYSVASAGDYNQDGFDDILVASPSATFNSRANAGVCYLIFGYDTQSTAAFDIDLSQTSLSANAYGFEVYICIIIYLYL